MFDSQGSFIPYDRYIFVPYILLISVNLCKIEFHDNELKLFELHENSSVFRAIPVYQVVRVVVHLCKVSQWTRSLRKHDLRKLGQLYVNDLLIGRCF